MIGRFVAVSAILAGAGGAFGLGERAQGAIVNWLSASGGDFSTGTNWQDGTPPTDLDRARFGLDATYEVSISGSPTTLGAQFRGGDVTVNIVSGFWSLSDPDGTSIQVGQSLGENAMVEMIGGGVLLCESVAIGETLGATGRLDVLGSGMLCNNLIVIGEGGDGTLRVSNGSLLVANRSVVLGARLGGVGRLEVAGMESGVEVLEEITVGDPELSSVTPASGGDMSATPRGGAALSRVRVADGGSLSATTLTLGPNGLLEGDSEVMGNVVNGGVVRPGVEGAGALAIDGEYTQQQNGAIEFEIGGTIAGDQHDQLTATGAANISGSIAVTFEAGFTPLLGQSFTLLTATGGVAGFFNGISLPSAPAGTALVLNFDANAIRLVVEEAQGGVPGDIDGDGEVGSSDLALLLALWGTNDEGADLDGDGVVNSRDLAQLLALWTF